MLCHHSDESLWAHGTEELFVTLIVVKIFRCKYSQICIYRPCILRSPDNFPKCSVALYFLQSWPICSGHPVYNGNLAISQGLPLYTGSTVARFAFASHAGVFRKARISSLPTNACSTEDNIPFPSLANHVVLSKFWKADLDRRVTR